jgi:hypothetical protein
MNEQELRSLVGQVKAGRLNDLWQIANWYRDV